jgi:endonuclease/exonuclease/phosphatase family metal-dependent hydrolase
MLPKLAAHCGSLRTSWQSGDAVAGQGRASEQSTLTVLTLNAHQGLGGMRRRQLLSRIRDGLRAADADLVFLQEVGSDAAATAQYEILSDSVWPQFAYGRNAVAEGGDHGNAVLSKYPILRWQNIDVSVAYCEPRGLLHCELEVPGAVHPLHAICLHLGLRESQRRPQVERLLQLIETLPHDAPLVVAGDYNDWRLSAHARLQGHGLQEVFATAAGAPARTFPSWRPLLRLDRIYVRNLQHRPLAAPDQRWSGLSDHRPLAAEIRLNCATGAAATGRRTDQIDVVKA